MKALTHLTNLSEKDGFALMVTMLSFLSAQDYTPSLSPPSQVQQIMVS